MATSDGVADVVRRIRDHATVSYDPNIRPALMGTPADVMGPAVSYARTAFVTMPVLFLFIWGQVSGGL